MGRKGIRTLHYLLSKDDIEKLKSAKMDSRERLAIFTLLYTGMRVGEFLHLRQEWIDWDRKIIQIPARQECDCYDCNIDYKYRLAKRNPRGETVRDDENKIIYKTVTKQREGIWKPKTEKGIRAIPIFPQFFPESYDALTEYFKTHKAIMETYTNRREIWGLIQSVAKRAGITHKIFPHAFRGTYATLLANAGVSDFHIVDALGWEDIATAKKYISISGEQLREAMERKLSAYLGK